MRTLKAAILVLILSVLLAVWAQASLVKALSFDFGSFTNVDCGKNNTCDLKWAAAITEDYEVMVDGESHFGTRQFTEYETASMETLEKYSFVQFLKGCKFDSFERDGRVIKIVESNSIWHFGEPKVFRFPEWTIDSWDKDPIYGSIPGDRHSFYRWNTFGSKSKIGEKFYRQEMPPTPSLYVSDRPGTAFLYGGTARNISLQFKICLYKTADVPQETTGENINFGTPIHCFTWKSSFIYDHVANVFEKKDNIDPICFEK